MEIKINMKELINALKGKGKIWAVIALAALGIVLIITGGCASGQAESSQTSLSGNTVTEYEARLEAKIKNLCENVMGVSDVTVAVSLSGGYENVYAQNGSSDYVLIGNGSSENGVFLNERSPQINGIGIVCRGGGDPRIQQELLSLISAACGVGKNRIFITEAQK